MTVGFIPDHGAMAATWVSLFVSGTPKGRASAWEKWQKGHGVAAWADEEAWALSAYRCEDCHRVELYASERPDPSVTLHRQ